jgi:spore coat polysaccharide biosynthesis protein SpsF
MILALVQARMNSQRLKDKVMKDVLGRPLIGFLLERLAFAQRIDKIVLATSKGKENEDLSDYVQGLGFDVFRGSEDDVLDRFYQAAKGYRAKTIMRVTGDCPLICPDLCDRLIAHFQKSNVDYACFSQRFAEGLDCEIFSGEALATAHHKAHLRSEREHLTLYIHNHPELFKKLLLENDADEGHYRITVDEPQDFAVVKAILEALYQKDRPPFGFPEIKDFLDRHPEISRLNSKVIRNEGLIKSLKNDAIVKPN